jgi:hypothetical protein
MDFDEFEKLPTDESVYPHRSGDFIVIGPQCFAAMDERVLNWKGANYETQPDRSLIDDLTRVRAQLIGAENALGALVGPMIAANFNSTKRRAA